MFEHCTDTDIGAVNRQLKGDGRMKVLKGFLVTVITLVVLMVANIICNKNGIELDTVVTGTTAAIAAMFIYEGITKKDHRDKK